MGRMVRVKYDPNSKLTREEIEMLEKAAKMPIVFDEDLPEFTEEELKEFYRVSEVGHQSRRKKTITLRISPQALDKAKSLGKGYTSVLSRILEKALNDPELIKQNL